ncbi:MAG: putative toxin-antitoxin system toxin component, PIN family [Candidatus Aminicenantes bacterium]|nr:putative toxin-antitoxin system toxin component, PIN family [Candidatus Aminicenantes bacterium]
MNLVIDTNVLVESISSGSPYHKIFRSIIDGTNNLIISNEILLEYFEIFERIYSEQTIREISIFFNYSPFILKNNPHYRFNLIKVDEEDNKFVDCAICGNCDLIVTSDHHFNVLKEIDFPKVSIITPGEFIRQFL